MERGLRRLGRLRFNTSAPWPAPARMLAAGRTLWYCCGMPARCSATRSIGGERTKQVHGAAPRGDRRGGFIEARAGGAARLRVVLPRRDGSVTPAEIGANRSWAESRHGRLRRLRAHDVRDLAPRTKADLHGRAVLGCRRQVTARAEETADVAEEAEELLGRTLRPQALHSPLPEASGLVRLLDTVVSSGRRVHLQVLEACKLGKVL